MTYSLQFTERMTGAFSFAETDYQAGYESGQRAGNRLSFRLTIAADDVGSFMADPRHAAVASGYVDCDPLGGRRPVAEGAFDLFTDAGPATRHMLYRLYFADGTGRPLTLAGYKDVRPGPLTAVWPETSTLYVRILDGHVPVADGGSDATEEGLVGSGILRIPLADFAWQLTTFRVHGPTLRGRIRAFDSFGQLFLSELWQVFDPLRPPYAAARDRQEQQVHVQHDDDRADKVGGQVGEPAVGEQAHDPPVTGEQDQRD